MKKNKSKDIQDLLEKTNDNYFITGKAGTGKSTLLRDFKLKSDKNIAVVAPTGIAAINVGGSTIHSFFRLPPKVLDNSMIRPNAKLGKILKHLDTLVIDEISMVRADLLDAIDYSLRINRHAIDIPFGGVQVICFGDMMQLPPVVQGREMASFLSESYKGPYFFNAKVFSEVNFFIIELKEVFRQTDKDFIELLDRIRTNRIDTTVLQAFDARVYQSEDLDNIFENQSPIVLLTPNNYRANYINELKLDALEGVVHKCHARINGEFTESIYPTQDILQLKVGAQIIMLRNDAGLQRWQNGTLGIVSKLTPDSIWVIIGDNEYRIDIATWDNIEYKYNMESNKLEEHSKGNFTQFPLKLAWAITIHKSQGQTFDNVIIDLDNGAFTHGQTYVALSRCRQLQGIFLTRQIRKGDIIVDPKILEFLASYKPIG